MNPTQVLSVAPVRPERGKRKTVFITVDFDGVCEEDEDDVGKYRFTFAGNGVMPPAEKSFAGRGGHVPEKQYCSLCPHAGDSIDDVTSKRRHLGDLNSRPASARAENARRQRFDRAKMNETAPGSWFAT